MGEAAEHLTVSRKFGPTMPVEELAMADMSVTEAITRKITEDERQGYNEEIAQLSLKISDEEAEKKEVVDGYKLSLKAKRKELASSLQVVKTGEREQLLPVAVFMDWDNLKVWKYKPDGEMLSVRAMTSKERQRKIV